MRKRKFASEIYWPLVAFLNLQCNGPGSIKIKIMSDEMTNVQGFFFPLDTTFMAQKGFIHCKRIILIPIPYN